MPFVDGRIARALLVSIALHVGFFFPSSEATPVAAAALTMSAKVKLLVDAAATVGFGVGGDGAPERRLPGFLSSLRGGGGPTLRTVVKAEAMAASFFFFF